MKNPPPNATIREKEEAARKALDAAWKAAGQAERAAEVATGVARKAALTVWEVAWLEVLRATKVARKAAVATVAARKVVA